MLFVSHKYSAIPLYLFLLVIILKQFKKQSWIILLALVAIVAASDLFSSQVMKPYFKRPRPCHDSSLSSKMTLVYECGGKYGMASSHAANTFAVACFLVALLKKSHKWIWWLLAWSLLVSFSRIYLGVHFPGDVLAGLALGFLVQLGIFHLVKLTMKISIANVDFP